MPAIFSSQDSATVGMLRGMLHHEGIPCEVRNEASHALLGEVALAGLVVPELWVIHESDRERAKELVFAFLNAPPKGPAADWTCPACGEHVDGVFAECWNCGAAAPAVTEG